MNCLVKESFNTSCCFIVRLFTNLLNSNKYGVIWPFNSTLLLIDLGSSTFFKPYKESPDIRHSPYIDFNCLLHPLNNNYLILESPGSISGETVNGY